MATIAAGATTTITLKEGQTLHLRGSAELYLRPGFPEVVNGYGRFGPFTTDMAVSVKALTAVVYSQNYTNEAFESEMLIRGDGKRVVGVVNDDSTESIFAFAGKDENLKSSVTWLPFLPTSQISSGTRTAHITTSAPEGFTGVQLIFPNPGPQTTVTSAAVAVTEDLVNPIVPKIGGVEYNAVATNTPIASQLGWVPVTFGGNASGTLLAGTVTIPTYLVSDIINLRSIPRTDGGKFSLIMARMYYSAATFPVRAAIVPGHEFLNQQMAPYHYFSYLQAADGVSNPAAFTTTTQNNNIHAIGFIFHTASGGKTVMLVGDSIMAGGSESTTNEHRANAMFNSWGFQAVKNAAIRLNKFIGISQASLGGATPAQYYNRMNVQLAAGIDPTLVLHAPWSPNGDSGIFPPAGRVNENIWHNRAALIMTAGRDKGFKYIFSTPTPMETYSDSVREKARSDILRYPAPVIDLNAVFYNPAGAGDNKWVAEYRFDALHPNDVGHSAAGVYATDAIIDALGEYY
jgi:lysophospholipase L1-like esterase